MSLPRVDFYLLNDTTLDAHFKIACRLVEKAYFNQHRIFVCCETRDDAIRLDQLLWTYKEESFIPHALIWENFLPTPPILIGYKHLPDNPADLIFNLTHDLPLNTKALTRIIEIVAPSEAAKTMSREHYRAYRAQGFELNTHTLS
jgi:DNA polymerase-3 subunit chi